MNAEIIIKWHHTYQAHSKNGNPHNKEFPALIDPLEI